jgi:hypothetical protein
MLCTPEDGETRCMLSGFGLLGSYPGMDEYLVEDSGTWLVALQGDELTGAQALIFLDPLDDSGESEVAVDDQSTQVCTEVALAALDPVGRRNAPGLDGPGAAASWFIRPSAREDKAHRGEGGQAKEQGLDIGK